MPSNPGLTQGIRRAIQVRGEGTAIIDGDVRISWTGFADRVARLAAAFRAKGLTPGGRVVLLALNSHHSITCFFAAMHAGG
jgi:long-chain acyl-CoA synthetase